MPAPHKDITGSCLDRQIAATNGLLHKALITKDYGEIAVVSSFGAESAVLLHLVAAIKADAPVIFINTHMLFAETLDYKAALIRHLGLSNVRTTGPTADAMRKHDPWGRLHATNPDACCDFRKSAVLAKALAGFDGWITGRKRFQAVTRADLRVVERAKDGKAKLNPMADWSAIDLQQYADRFDLPQHPLVAHGYASIGCASCTSPIKPGEDNRAGRWRNTDKTECGIHFANGKIMRGGADNATR